MTVKTITVTEDAYKALKGLKEPLESFSETLLRVTKKHSLLEFVGILSEESADRLENKIREFRKQHNQTHKKRIKKITIALGES